MSPSNIVRVLCIAILWCSQLLLTSCSDQTSSRAPQEFTALVFSKTTGFRHQSIPDGVAAIQSLGDEHGFHVEASEDAAVFTPADLARYEVVIFLNTTGDILDPEQQSAFQAFIRNGGGFVGIHSASDTEHDWAWYAELVGALFVSHPEIQAATMNVVDASHLSTMQLPSEWSRTDEWYNFRDVPNPGVNVLITLDEATYSGGTMGDLHPVSWYHEFDGGRSWYTAMGHTSASYAEPLFRQHLLGGIMWAAGTTTQFPLP